eukprot:TRINITY_DN14242_c0_g1_i4.p1 TRINITY_DN14242_c0_g1~~TRINITY_DN14242_c0_g1_i4.p1  ORF type:complete len:547 (-),score=94.57 TRINITY_DN14242_c0_g1_i4:18-1658(-)
MLRPWWLCLALVAATQMLLSNGQILHLDNVKIPPPHALMTLHAFFVYSKEEAPGPAIEEPFARLAEISATAPPGMVLELDGRPYEGVQVGLMRYAAFWKLVDPQKLCSSWDDVLVGKAQTAGQLLLHGLTGQGYDSGDVIMQTVPVRNVSKGLSRVKGKDDVDDSKQYDISKTGIYVLVVSNCGGAQHLKLSGTITVMNAYGFLPGSEYPRMGFYGYLALCYGLLGIAWTVLSIRHRGELFKIQYCIAGVIFVGLVECLGWFAFLRAWNGAGEPAQGLFVATILMSVTKTTLSYMLVLVGSMGWGVTRPHLGNSLACRIGCLAFVYILLDFIRQTVLAFTHSKQLSLMFVVGCLLPVALLSVVTFYWTLSSLSTLIEQLQENRQTEKLTLFKRLWRVLAGAIAISGFTMLVQVYNLSRSISQSWQQHWLLVDGIPHLLFLLVLVAMMFLWAPHEGSKRYAYCEQLDMADADPEPAADISRASPTPDQVGRRGGDLDDGDSLYPPVGSQLHAEVIGSIVLGGHDFGMRCTSVLLLRAANKTGCSFRN